MRAGKRDVCAWFGLLFLLLAEFFLSQSGLVEGAVGLAAAATATAAVGAALLVCVLLAARSARPLAPTRIRTALRGRALRTAFLPQRDPDASGRPRPRAPGRSLLTAG